MVDRDGEAGGHEGDDGEELPERAALGEGVERRALHDDLRRHPGEDEHPAPACVKNIDERVAGERRGLGPEACLRLAERVEHGREIGADGSRVLTRGRVSDRAKADRTLRVDRWRGRAYDGSDPGVSRANG
jgi:hypothetical protein